MAQYTQAGRPLSISTPLGTDVLLLTAVNGVEAVSSPFHFELEMLSERPGEVSFPNLLGQPVTVTLQISGSPARYINGVMTRLVQGPQVRLIEGTATFVRYRATIAPRFWLLSKRRQNRIFQQKTVPAILKEVLAGLDARWQLTGEYQPRDYCVQYRESDFAFASRLMEEEGIAYYFEHAEHNHVMVAADTAAGFARLPGQDRLSYSSHPGGQTGARRVHFWEKQQDIVSSQCTLRDHCFELTEHILESNQKLSGSVLVGVEAHPLVVGPAGELTLADYPGGYAQRFDGVSAYAQPQPESLAKIFDDGRRTAHLRMELEAAQSLKIRGASDYGHLTPGYACTLAEHFNGNGDYLLTEVAHSIDVSALYLTDEAPAVIYKNRFECLPAGLTYRPPRLTPCPRIEGTQSATVAGPAGSQIFCDKYGRIKVQFRWDRQGKNDARSSCWLRVSQPWAGQGFGSFHLPRVGQEVVVAFEEGDPDKPIVIGSVYNNQNMPPYQLPAQAAHTGLLSRTINGTAGNASELRFQDDVLGQEKLVLHAERDMLTSTENNRVETVGNQHQLLVGQGLYVSVGGSADSASGGSSENGSSDKTTEIGGITYEVTGAWSRTSGSVREMTLGNEFAFVAGASEQLVFGEEFNLYCGNTMNITLISAININAGVFTLNFNAGYTVNYSYGGTYVIDETWLINETTDFTKTVKGAMETIVGGTRLDSTAGSHDINSTSAITITSISGITIEVVDASILMSTSGIFMSFGSASILLSAAGITLSVGDSSIVMTESSILLSSAAIVQVEG